VPHISSIQPCLILSTSTPVLQGLSELTTSHWSAAAPGRVTAFTSPRLAGEIPSLRVCPVPPSCHPHPHSTDPATRAPPGSPRPATVPAKATVTARWAPLEQPIRPAVRVACPAYGQCGLLCSMSRQMVRPGDLGLFRPSYHRGIQILIKLLRLSENHFNFQNSCKFVEKFIKIQNKFLFNPLE
jgi:hypothetical protein